MLGDVGLTWSSKDCLVGCQEVSATSVGITQRVGTAITARKAIIETLKMPWHTRKRAACVTVILWVLVESFATKPMGSARVKMVLQVLSVIGVQNVTKSGSPIAPCIKVPRSSIAAAPRRGSLHSSCSPDFGYSSRLQQKQKANQNVDKSLFPLFVFR